MNIIVFTFLLLCAVCKREFYNVDKHYWVQSTFKTGRTGSFLAMTKHASSQMFQNTCYARIIFWRPSADREGQTVVGARESLNGRKLCIIFFTAFSFVRLYFPSSQLTAPACSPAAQYKLHNTCHHCATRFSVLRCFFVDFIISELINWDPLSSSSLSVAKTHSLLDDCTTQDQEPPPTNESDHGHTPPHRPLFLMMKLNSAICLVREFTIDLGWKEKGVNFFYFTPFKTEVLVLEISQTP